MERTVNVRFYSVENLEGDAVKFSDCLNNVAAMNLPDREYEVEPETVVRLESLKTINGHFLSGHLVRLQSHNLPPKALPGQPIEKLGVASIGHTASFLYDSKRSVLAMQMPRNGLNPYRLNLYHQELLSVMGHDILPLLTSDAWSKLASNRIRKLFIRVATPEKLSAVTPDQVAMRDSLNAMKKVAETNYVEAIFGMGRSPEDIGKDKAKSLLRWIIGEKDADNGGVRRVAAEIINDDEDHEILKMINGHMGDKSKLDLPDDDPAKAHDKIEDYIVNLFQKFGAEIDAQIGN